MTCDHEWHNVDVYCDENSVTHLQRCARCGARRTVYLDGDNEPHVYMEGEGDALRERLVQFDIAFDRLGASLVDFLDLGFDPDAYFTPCESVFQDLVEDLGFEYRAIREEAYRREKEVEE